MTRLDGEAGTPAVDDHPFRPPLWQPWGLCTVRDCGLSEAAHTRAVPGGSYAEHLAAQPQPVRDHAKGCPWPHERCTCRDGHR